MTNYYEIWQDKNLRNRIEIDNFKGCPDIVLDKSMAEDLRKCTILPVHGTKESLYPDLLQSPVLMISEKLYRVLKYYDIDVIYKIVVLLDAKRNRQENYRLMLPETLDVLDETTTYDFQGCLKDIVLSGEIPKTRRIFYVSEKITHHLVVTEDVLESILAVGSIGIRFRKLKQRV